MIDKIFPNDIFIFCWGVTAWANRNKGTWGVKKKIQKKDKDKACSIFISCGQPSEDGKLSVEMTYEGDPILASYLLKSAQGFIEQDEDRLSN